MIACLVGFSTLLQTTFHLQIRTLCDIRDKNFQGSSVATNEKAVLSIPIGGFNFTNLRHRDPSNIEFLT